MKRKVISVLLASTMVFSMAACGSSGAADDGAAKDNAAATDDTAAADEKEEAPVTEGSGGENSLTVWCWDPNFNIYSIEKAAEIYAKDHEGFTVNVSEIQSDDIEARITTAVNANDLSTLPDIFLMQDNSFQKYTSFYPQVFTDLTNSGIDFSEFAPATVAYSTLDGVNYGVPFDNGAVTNCIRTDMLEAAGFTIDDFTDITWSEYIEKGKKVAEANGQPMLVGQAGSGDLIMMMLQSCGASLFAEDGSANIANNEILKQCVETYVQMVNEGVLGEVVDWDQYISALNSGTAASTINGCWIMASVRAAEDQSGKWAITNMPRLDGVENASNYSNNGGSSWAITSNCKDVDLAVDFLKSTFGGSTEFYDDIIQKGALATWAPAGDSDVYGQEVEFFGGDQVYAKIVDFATKTPSNKTGPFYYDASNAVAVAISNIVQSGMDIDKALQQAQEEVDFSMNA